MAVDYEIRKVTDADIEYLAENLRDIDRREVAAVTGRSVKAAIISGSRMSDYCRVGCADGVPFCIYGVRRMSATSDSGIIWMLATDDLPKHAIKFGRECGNEVRKMLDGFKLVENWCHADNKITIRWLKWLGFTFKDAAPYGKMGEPFHHFYMEAA